MGAASHQQRGYQQAQASFTDDECRRALIGEDQT
jgi:hypothetical protein